MQSFSVIHSGYLYKEQNIEIFLSAFKKLIDNYGKKVDISVCFTGVEYDLKNVDRLVNYMSEYRSNLATTPRLSFNDCLSMEVDADILLITAYGDKKGIPSSKLYQYMGHRKPIMLCPSDHDIIQSILEETNLGLIANNEHTAYTLLEKSLLEKLEHGVVSVKPDENAIERYSRRNQVQKMAKLLKRL